MLTYLGIADKFKPKWILWENVPGVLSSNGGKDFACFLQGLAELGYGFAYRVLDAQYFGVPQRRKRVFVVGCLGGWRSAAKVLFESESLQRDITPSRSEKQEITDTFIPSVANCLQTTCHEWSRADGFNMISYSIAENIIGRKPHNGGNGNGYSENIMYTLNATGVHGVAVDTYNGTIQGDVTATMTADMAGPTHSGPKVMQQMRVRRLTPMECERLQGFPDGYTHTPTSSDTTRYKALGNSMAVPVMKWIGQRINELS
jgi:DNA (cytosine-5)-methyltransferase 1